MIEVVPYSGTPNWMNFVGAQGLRPENCPGKELASGRSILLESSDLCRGEVKVNWNRDSGLHLESLANVNHILA